MIRLLWRTDIHCADKSPSFRTDNWMSTILDKLDQISTIARDRKVDAVIDGGDIFDRKSPFLNSHMMVRSLAKSHKSYPCPIYVNVGNHDCVYSDIAYLNSQPLGVLYDTGIFQRLYDENELLIEKDGITVRVCGVPYHGVKYDKSRLDIKKGKEDYLVVAAHLLASKTGTSMFESEDIIPYSDLEPLAPDIWCFGHWHKDQGITKLSNGGHVVNVGSLTRGSLSEDNLDRKPCVVLMEFDQTGIHIERINLKVKTPDLCFDLARKEEEVGREVMLDDFISILSKSSFKIDSQRDIYTVLRSNNDLTSEVRDRSIFYIEEVERTKQRIT